MADRKQCEFQLIRYVPDPVKNEFVNIGVLLRSAAGDGAAVRFTRDWRRVRCMDSAADTAMLEALESEIARRLEEQAARAGDAKSEAKPIVDVLEDSLSNLLRITERKAFLAESFPAGLEQLLGLYVEPVKQERTARRGGRAAIYASMRSQFEQAGVWNLMRKQIPAANYTRPGDPLRIDCGYRPNGVVRMFHAVALDKDADAAKALAFGARAIREGIARLEKAELELTAIVQPLRSAAEHPAEDEQMVEYRFAVETMEEENIRVMTVPDLPRIAATARRELHV